MLYSTLVVAASAFAGLASAQNSTTNFNTPIPCCSVPASSVNSTLKSSWCEANTNTCVDICGGQAQIASNGNSCDDSTLDFTCKCQNGTDAKSAMSAYQQSVPGQMCRYWYMECVDASGSDANKRFQCEQALNSQCGNLTITENGAVATASSSAASGSGAAASRTPTASASGSSSSPSTGAAAALAQYGAPLLAGGLLAVFGVAL